jgi:hypothetical protein
LDLWQTNLAHFDVLHQAGEGVIDFFEEDDWHGDCSPGDMRMGEVKLMA